MTWVDIDDDARRLPHVLASPSLDDAALRARLGLYRTIMFDESGLFRVADGLDVELERAWPPSARAPRRYGIGGRSE